MRLCPRCRAEFSDTSLEVCPFDNWGLVTAEDYHEAEGDPMLGALLAGRFRIVGRVGVGAMGTVYRAIQASVERAVALKVLRADLTKDPDTAARFHREAHATSALKHPNTVTLYDFGQTEDGHLYIAMELLEGRLLGRVVKEEGALPIETSVRIVTQVARSLAEAHRKGIVHRDLKPDNIILAQVEGQEVVKVLDFGIAKVVRGERRIDALETQAGTVFGTPRFMSPEQAQSKLLDARSDLYSLGVIFYQLLTGHAPFEDSDAVVVMARHIKTKPRRPSDVRPDLNIPTRLERLVLRMLEKDRNKRPQSAEELIDILQRFLQNQDDEYSFASRYSKPTSRRRLVPYFAAIGVLLMVAIGGVISFALTRESRGDVEVRRTTTPVNVHSTKNLVKVSEAPDAKASQFDEVDLTVDSEPSGALITRDGNQVGTTPLMLKERSGSTVSFTFELAGYHTKTAVIKVSPDDTSHLVVLSHDRSAFYRWRRMKRDRMRSKNKQAGSSESEESSRPSSPYGRFDDK